MKANLGAGAFVAEHEIFLPVNTDKEEKRLPDAGKENGAANSPSAQATRHDAVEQSIIASVTQTAQQTKGALSAHFAGFHQRLVDILSTEKPRALMNKIETVKSAVKADLGNALDKFKNEAVLFEKDWRAAEKEYETFREKNALTRQPDYMRLRAVLLWFTLIILVEASLNATLLWDLTGLLPAIGQTALITAVNVLFGASLVGLLFRYKNNALRKGARHLAWICIPVSLGVLTFNLGVGHYRDALVDAKSKIEALLLSPSSDAEPLDFGFFDYAQNAMDNLLASPFGIDSILSALLCIVGIGFFGFATHKWYTMFDPYPGYRKRHQTLTKKHDNYMRLVEATRARIAGQIKDAEDRVSDERTKLMNMRTQHNELSERARMLQEGYAAWIVVLERKLNHLLEIYRDNNRRARTEQAPAHFGDDMRFRQIDAKLPAPPGFSPPVLEEKEVDDVVKTVQAAEKEIQKISDGVWEKFRQLANMQRGE